jgi:hypothetical protein
VARGQFAHLRARALAIDAQSRARLAPEQHVLPHAQAFDQFEVLVDEPDRAERLDRPLVGRDFAVGDRGQRRFARAVLADERVDVARAQFEVDAVDRRDRAEALADAPER